MSRRCTATCKDGTPCQGWAERGSDPPRCGVHGTNRNPRAPAERRCTAICKDGTPCQGWAAHGTDPPRCGVHGPSRRPRAPADRRCTALRNGGGPCQGWAVPGTDPPRCGVHGGGSKPPGPPKGHQNALKHGFFAKPDLPPHPTIDDIIQELFHRYLRLDAYIDELFRSGHPSPKEVIHPVCIHGQTANKLRKLLLMRQEFRQWQAEAGMRAALYQALAELSEELDTDLLP